MNILLIDSAAYTSSMCDNLESLGYKVFLAHNLYDAWYHWINEKIDCIISCVMISADGLTKKEKQESHNADLAGWVWLKRRIFNEFPEMKARTIIYSASLNHLKENVSQDELEGMRLVGKIYLGAEKIIEALALIRKSLEEN
jgi:hypothetical protein